MGAKKAKSQKTKKAALRMMERAGKKVKASKQRARKYAQKKERLTKQTQKRERAHKYRQRIQKTRRGKAVKTTMKSNRLRGRKEHTKTITTSTERTSQENKP